MNIVTSATAVCALTIALSAQQVVSGKKSDATLIPSAPPVGPTHKPVMPPLATAGKEAVDTSRGLSTLEMSVLMRVMFVPGIRPSEVASSLDLSLGEVADALDCLLALGFISRSVAA